MCLILTHLVCVIIILLSYFIIDKDFNFNCLIISNLNDVCLIGINLQNIKTIR